MSKFKSYILNPETLLYEHEPVPRRTRVFHLILGILFGVSLSVLYFWIYISVLGFDPPKTALLKKANDRWSSRIDLMNLQLDKYETTLDGLEMRNDNVYRSIFGMDEISQDLLRSGLADAGRYKFLEGISAGSKLKETYVRLDNIMKEVYVQSMSLDEVSLLSRNAGDMASCTPAIPPIFPRPGSFRVSSRFGSRVDPIRGYRTFHSGVDFSAKKGTPIYVTADGTVEEVKFLFFGYGRYVTVDHGFGYKTMYAHMNDINVTEGMKVRRGQSLGTVGSTGRSTGAHLHYEVHYRGNRVNPANYYDINMPVEDYADLIKGVPLQTEGMPVNQFHFRDK